MPIGITFSPASGRVLGNSSLQHTTPGGTPECQGVSADLFRHEREIEAVAIPSMPLLLPQALPKMSVRPPSAVGQDKQPGARCQSRTTETVPKRGKGCGRLSANASTCPSSPRLVHPVSRTTRRFANHCAGFSGLVEISLHSGTVMPSWDSTRSKSARRLRRTCLPSGVESPSPCFSFHRWEHSADRGIWTTCPVPATPTCRSHVGCMLPYKKFCSLEKRLLFTIRQFPANWSLCLCRRLIRSFHRRQITKLQY